MKVEHVRVGDVLKLQRRVVKIDPLHEYCLVGVYSFGKGLFHREPRLGSDLGDYRFFFIEPGDLVLSNIQAWEGAIGYATTSDAGVIGTHRFLTYTAVSDRIDANWARWFFLSDAGMHLIRSAAPGTTMRNRTLAISRFEELQIPLPPLEEQQRAVTYMQTISGWTRALRDHTNVNSSTHLIGALPSLTDAVFGGVDWTRTHLGDVAELVADTVHPGDNPSPADSFVGLQHIESHTGRRIGSDELAILKGRKFRFRPGDVLYGYLRPYLNKVWVADRHGLCSVDQYVLRPRKGISPDLLAYALRARSVLNAAIDLTHSLQLPRLRSGLLLSMEVPVAPKDSAAEVLARLNDVRDRVVALAAKRSSQVELTEALIPAALNEMFASLI